MEFFTKFIEFIIELIALIKKYFSSDETNEE